MKIAVIIIRTLLGLMFVFFGANILHPFLPMPPQPPSDAATFGAILMKSHFMFVVGLFQFIGGLLLLVGRFVPLGITLLGPVIFNILLFHICLEPKGIANGLVAAVLWLILLLAYRKYFAGLFAVTAAIA